MREATLDLLGQFIGLRPEYADHYHETIVKRRSQAAQITLAISDEPVGGSPAGAPTGDVLAAGAMSEL